jgi:hypothetical protein
MNKSGEQLRLRLGFEFGFGWVTMLSRILFFLAALPVRFLHKRAQARWNEMSAHCILPQHCVLSSLPFNFPPPLRRGLEMATKIKEKSEHKKSLHQHFSCVFPLLSSSPTLRPSPRNLQSSTTLQKSCSQLCAGWCPLIHTHIQHKHAHPTIKTSSYHTYLHPIPLPHITPTSHQTFTG